MIYQLFGTFAEMADDGAMVIITGGDVGYGVIVTDREREVINRAGLGVEHLVHVHTIMNESAMKLYGFIDRDDKRAFCKIIDVDRLGVATGMRILSVLPAFALKQAIEDKNTAALMKIPGVGKKTAEKIVAEVKL